MAYERQKLPELFDIQEDPLETRNIAESAPGIVSAMSLKLTKWRTGRTAPLRVESPKADIVSKELMKNLKTMGYVGDNASAVIR